MKLVQMILKDYNPSPEDLDDSDNWNMEGPNLSELTAEEKAMYI